jgi:drug/metabolite transporter (DMT)-like permease
MLWLSFLILFSTVLFKMRHNKLNGTQLENGRVFRTGMITMNTTAYLGLYSLSAGLVFFFTSGTFGLLFPSLGAIFLSLGVVFIYIGVAFVLWNFLSSFNVLLERIVGRD